MKSTWNRVLFRYQLVSENIVISFYHDSFIAMICLMYYVHALLKFLKVEISTVFVQICSELLTATCKANREKKSKTKNHNSRDKLLRFSLLALLLPEAASRLRICPPV